MVLCKVVPSGQISEAKRVSGILSILRKQEFDKSKSLVMWNNQKCLRNLLMPSEFGWHQYPRLQKSTFGLMPPLLGFCPTVKSLPPVKVSDLNFPPRATFSSRAEFRRGRDQADGRLPELLQLWVLKLVQIWRHHQIPRTIIVLFHCKSYFHTPTAAPLEALEGLELVLPH